MTAKSNLWNIVLRDAVQRAITAEQTGINFINLGAHHRDDCTISAPEIVLAAIAGKTDKIRLGTCVTFLSWDDPVRVFRWFSTLNAMSNGRVKASGGQSDWGPGSFTESNPWSGYELQDYEHLFKEKLDLLAKRGVAKRVGSSPGIGDAGCATGLGVDVGHHLW
jgi:alkanesulfonate monooxygenase SsuD/methylene tetrahydromethanopterin reductase-like flavin-dependent oxidoreductase (luciferase family)